MSSLTSCYISNWRKLCSKDPKKASSFQKVWSVDLCTSCSIPNSFLSFHKLCFQFLSLWILHFTTNPVLSSTFCYFSLWQMDKKCNNELKGQLIQWIASISSTAGMKCKVSDCRFQLLLWNPASLCVRLLKWGNHRALTLFFMTHSMTFKLMRLSSVRKTRTGLARRWLAWWMDFRICCSSLLQAVSHVTFA